jgi:protein-ribulosamine 3-kinase
MTIKNEITPGQKAARLGFDPMRTRIEEIVSAHIGRNWRLKKATDKSDFASHPCAILSDDTYSIFAKFSEATNGLEQFQTELAGLRLLAERADILIPAPIGIISLPDGSILIMENVQPVERSYHQWREIGRTLARIHQVKGEAFGLETDGYFGPLFQENTPSKDWPTFFAEHRLGAGLKMAIDSGNLPAELIGQVEKVIAHLPDLCGPEISPSLLHGDAQQNNFISTTKGAVVIDPAVYYGHPEMGLAYIDYFQPVPADVLDGYREILPIDPGFEERKELWRIWGYLAVVSVEGAQYLGRLSEAVRSYQ